MAVRRRPKTIVIVEVPYTEFEHDRGEFYLGSGIHEVEITTRSEPHRVWVYTQSDDTIPVCHGNVDKVGVTVTPTGFVVHAQINSTGALIEWIADLQE